VVQRSSSKVPYCNTRLWSNVAIGEFGSGFSTFKFLRNQKMAQLEKVKQQLERLKIQIKEGSLSESKQTPEGKSNLQWLESIVSVGVSFGYLYFDKMRFNAAQRQHATKKSELKIEVEKLIKHSHTDEHVLESVKEKLENTYDEYKKCIISGQDAYICSTVMTSLSNKNNGQVPVYEVKAALDKEPQVAVEEIVNTYDKLVNERINELFITTLGYMTLRGVFDVCRLYMNYKSLSMVYSENSTNKRKIENRQNQILLLIEDVIDYIDEYDDGERLKMCKKLLRSIDQLSIDLDNEILSMKNDAERCKAQQTNNLINGLDGLFSFSRIVYYGFSLWPSLSAATKMFLFGAGTLAAANVAGNGISYYNLDELVKNYDEDVRQFSKLKTAIMELSEIMDQY